MPVLHFNQTFPFNVSSALIERNQQWDEKKNNQKERKKEKREKRRGEKSSF